jgi:hydroxypyruvate isomerase
LPWAAEQAAPHGIDILIEPLNLRDNPGYFLNRQDHAHEIVQAVGLPNVKVQFDLYHTQIVEGDLAMKIRQFLPTGRVGHMQIAGVPERHEPDVGEINYPYIFQVIDDVSAQCGWQGWLGCEYRPKRGTAAGATTAGLGWLKT